MDEDTTETLRQHNIELDQIIADVMPDDWEGHARIAIRESDEIPKSLEEKAILKAARLAEDKGVAPTRVATKLIDKVADQ